jgi:outer membrane protein OmpA-like peptidoglycan-associated protein
LQQIDFTGFHGPTNTAEWQKLMRSLARTLGRPELSTAAVEAAQAGVRGEAPLTRPGRSLILAGAALIISVAGAGLAVMSYLGAGTDGQAAGGDEVVSAAPYAAAEPAVMSEAVPQEVFVPPPAGVSELQPGAACGDLKALVYFDFDRTHLTVQAQSILEEALTRGFGCELLEVRIEAHDDLISSPTYAEGVSQRRASAIADFLTAQGAVNSEWIVSIGFGSSQPLQPGERSPANRRAEILFDFEQVSPQPADAPEVAP